MKKKYKKYGLRYKKRGMQRIKTYRYPKRNIFGDRSIIKGYIVTGQTITVPTNASFVTQNLQFNSWPAIATAFGNAPNVGTLGARFNNYRISGIKTRITVWPDQNSLNTPVCVFTNAANESGNLVANPTVAQLPEVRWAKYRVCSNAGTGAKPTVLSSYYDVKKVWGPDSVVRNDIDFTGETNFQTTPSTWTAPTLGPFLQYGLFTMGGTNPTTAINATLKIETTVYGTFWGKQTANVT